MSGKDYMQNSFIFTPEKLPFTFIRLSLSLFLCISVFVHHSAGWDFPGFCSLSVSFICLSTAAHPGSVGTEWLLLLHIINKCNLTLPEQWAQICDKTKTKTRGVGVIWNFLVCALSHPKVASCISWGRKQCIARVGRANKDAQ